MKASCGCSCLSSCLCQDVLNPTVIQNTFSASRKLRMVAQSGKLQGSTSSGTSRYNAPGEENLQISWAPETVTARGATPELDFQPIDGVIDCVALMLVTAAFLRIAHAMNVELLQQV